MALPVTITGLSAVSGFAGPFKSAAGNYYIFARSSATSNVLVGKKATDPSTSWANLAASVTVPNCDTTYVSAHGSLAAVQDGDVIHIATCFADATATTSTRIHYHKYDMASDTWTLTNEAVDGPTTTAATTGGTYRSIAIIRRSASVVIAYQMPFVLSMSANYSRVGYRERTDAAGTWSAAVAVDALGTAQTTATHIGAIKDPQSNRIYFHWVEGVIAPVNLRVRTLSAANALNTASTTIVATPYGNQTIYPISGAAYVSGGVSKVVICKASGATTTAFISIYFDGADNPTVNSTSGTLPIATAALPPVGRIFADNGNAYFLYPRTDVYVSQSTNHGLTWGAFALTFDATGPTTNSPGSHNAGSVYVRGSSYVIPYVVDDSSVVKYNEHIVRAAAAAEINVTTGAQTTLATTQSATADVDLQVSAAQTTLATAQTGAISAQEARAVTGAQTTAEATQSATAGLWLAVTGAQTTSAASQSAAVDVDVKVTGSQNTLAASQAAAADVDLAVAGAQSTNATTQVGTIGAAVSLNVTGAQITLAASQSAAADVDLKVTGAQTLSAPASVATASVRLSLTGAQATQATTQSATARVLIKVTGAQTLLSSTQSLLADIDLKIIGAQTLSPPSSIGTIGSVVLTKTWIKHAGTWKPATPYVRHAGVWKPATVHVKQAGVWKQA